VDSTEWDAVYTRSAHPWGFEPNRFVREHCERLQVGSALDLGCGDGRHALWLARLGWRVTGVDFSPVAIARAEHRTGTRDAYQALRLGWQVANVIDLKLKASSIDLALMSYLGLPDEDRARLITHLAAAVRPRGHLVTVDDGGLDPVVLGDLLRSHGLVVEVARTAETPVGDAVATDTIVRARRPD
jgi:SAM-dependent methyltransferase